ncbi:alkaline phosphatase family protein [Halalkalibacterium ligniniphilum]|uniref:alkaline phosphatase family protein n=1 Tax=Halalkalibacterium ligniniphilum TaxID=1134413 RepID=UPI00034D36E8|nr:alkaline phosphatase family protein [Halalkalibacterium ligniniphilum]
MKKLVVILVIFLILFSLYSFGLRTPIKELSKHEIKPDEETKPVVLLVIDSLMDKPLQKAVQEGKAPALEFLMKQGEYQPDIVSSYPTMSVTIDSTLLTGAYAHLHKVPGLVWFNQKENRVINYGSGTREVIGTGIKQVANDSLFNLNQKHLSKNAKTIYEELITSDSSSINGIVYRGNQAHHFNIPKLAEGLNLIPEQLEVNGPTLLSMGGLSQYNPDNNGSNHLWQAMGMNDEFSANELKYFIEKNKLPSFTFAYFPDLDKEVHENGPMDIKGIEQVDKKIQTILNSYPSWDHAIQEGIWLVFGDSGQSTIMDNKNKSLIDLRKKLDRYNIWNLGKPIQQQDQLILAINERMAYVYLLDESITYSEIVSKLKEDPRVGFVAWKKGAINYVDTAKSEKPFTFSPNGEYSDRYGQSWSLNGNGAILDISVKDNNEILYGEYPDALARLHGALHSHEGKYVIIDAKPGYEFVGEHTPTHVGGAGHGSLHKKDSESPLIIAGTNRLPAHNRVVDFNEWIRELTK